MEETAIVIGVLQAAEIFRNWDDPADIGLRCLTIFGLVLLNRDSDRDTRRFRRGQRAVL